MSNTANPSDFKLPPSLWIYLVCPIAPAFAYLKCVGRPQRVLHELHVHHLPLPFINLAADTVRAPARPAQCPAPVRKAPEYRHIHQPGLTGRRLNATPSERAVGGTIGPAEDGVDRKLLVSPDLGHGRKGVDDGVGALVLVAVGVGAGSAR